MPATTYFHLLFLFLPSFPLQRFPSLFRIFFLHQEEEENSLFPSSHEFATVYNHEESTESIFISKKIKRHFNCEK